MVGTFNLMRKMPGGEKLVAMTRILHRQTLDEIPETEIPTFRCEGSGGVSCGAWGGGWLSQALEERTAVSIS